MSTKEWLKYNYPMAYANACDDALRLKGNRKLYFDERFWTRKNIQEFFEDLNFGDYEVWERIAFNLSPSHKVNKAKKRFEAWQRESATV